MGVKRKTYTKPLPAEATVVVRRGKRIAEWKAGKKIRTAPVTTGLDGSLRIVLTARTYTARYRDGNGHVREVPTGCRTEDAARVRLAELQRGAEKVRSGLLTSDENAAIAHQETPLVDHISAFIDHQRARGLSRRVNDTESQLRRVAADCGFRRLADLNPTKLERWLLDRGREGMSAGTRNQYRSAWVAFCNWCLGTTPPRLLSNPLARVPKADEKADPRRQRRALTEDELLRLLDVARRRPLLDRMTVRRGTRKGEAYAKLRPETRRRLERLGRERALVYKTLVLTGLRKGELASLTVGQLDLDAEPPYLVLDAADEKNREGNAVPLRADLATDLREWLAEKATLVAQDAAAESDSGPGVVRFDPEAFQAGKRNRDDSTGPEGHSCQRLPRLPGGLSADTPVFTVPAGLVRIFDRDLRLAGIPKVDERGRTIDVHALRHTFGTLLSKGGVAPRTAQAAMRHSSIDLTMNVYTDPKLLDVAGAVQSLPALPLAGSAPQEAKATGTTDAAPKKLAHVLAHPPGQNCNMPSTTGQFGQRGQERGPGEAIAVSGSPVKSKNPPNTAVRGFSEWAALDSNQRLPPCECVSTTTQDVESQGVTEADSVACPAASTQPASRVGAGGGLVEALAALVAGLSDEDRERLAALLAGERTPPMGGPRA